MMEGDPPALAPDIQGRTFVVGLRERARSGVGAGVQLQMIEISATNEHE